MPKKQNFDISHSDQARESIKEAMKEMGLKPEGLFVLLYGRQPKGNEVQVLRNRLGRGSTTSDFIGLCVSKLPPLQKKTLSEFFGIEPSSDE